MPEKQYKSFSFKGTLNWTGGRTWDFSGDVTPTFHGSPPEIFRGESGKLTPEDLMIASINSCLISTYTSITAKENFEFVSFSCETVGTIEHTEESGYRFTKMVQKVKIGVKSEDDKLIAQDLLNKAHHSCWMGNSIKAEIIIEPEIFVEG
ncbi:MAG: OsmC family protein [bacterium]|nr:OsmC family protein [bacterium]